MTAILATTPSVQIVETVTSLLSRALSNPEYTFPSLGLSGSESMGSLSTHHKSYSGSISSQPSTKGGLGKLGVREQILDDLGMRGLAELNFPVVKMDR
jgi:neurofibromin 1